jgi:uncharacterized membrane protein YfcA
MSPAEIIGLAASAAAAGLINAVAGGGTLITFPTLLLFGIPPLMANATSTLALVIGTFGGVFGYRKHLEAVKPWLWRLIPPSLLGGALGGWLLKNTTDQLFSKLVPFLILFATILFLLQGAIKRWTGKSPADAPSSSAGAVAGAILFQFAVAVYGGYFGAGIGILMLASLGVLGFGDIHQMNGMKTVLGALINLVAAALFIWAGLIDWPRAGIMTVGALAGYLAGAHWSQKIPQARVRQIVTAIGLVIAAVAFWKEFLK